MQQNRAQTSRKADRCNRGMLSVFKILTVGEAAVLARVSLPTIRGAILRGELKARDIGDGRRRYYRLISGDVLRWLGATFDTTGDHPGEA